MCTYFYQLLIGSLCCFNLLWSATVIRFISLYTQLKTPLLNRCQTQAAIFVLFLLDPDNLQLHCFLGLGALFSCSFFCHVRCCKQYMSPPNRWIRPPVKITQWFINTRHLLMAKMPMDQRFMLNIMWCDWTWCSALILSCTAPVNPSQVRDTSCNRTFNRTVIRQGLQASMI